MNNKELKEKLEAISKDGYNWFTLKEWKIDYSLSPEDLLLAIHKKLVKQMKVRKAIFKLASDDDSVRRLVREFNENDIIYIIKEKKKFKKSKLENLSEADKDKPNNCGSF